MNLFIKQKQAYRLRGLEMGRGEGGGMDRLGVWD